MKNRYYLNYNLPLATGFAIMYTWYLPHNKPFNTWADDEFNFSSAPGASMIQVRLMGYRKSDGNPLLVSSTYIGHYS